MSEVSDAVKVLTKALKEDEGFYYSYQANIAMAFKDEWDRKPVNDWKIHDIANKAARNFLDLWLKDTI